MLKVNEWVCRKRPARQASPFHELQEQVQRINPNHDKIAAPSVTLLLEYFVALSKALLNDDRKLYFHGTLATGEVGVANQTSHPPTKSKGKALLLSPETEGIIDRLKRAADGETDQYWAAVSFPRTNIGIDYFRKTLERVVDLSAYKGKILIVGDGKSIKDRETLVKGKTAAVLLVSTYRSPVTFPAAVKTWDLRARNEHLKSGGKEAKPINIDVLLGEMSRLHGFPSCLFDSEGGEIFLNQGDQDSLREYGRGMGARTGSNPKMFNNPPASIDIIISGITSQRERMSLVASVLKDLVTHSVPGSATREDLGHADLERDGGGGVATVDHCQPANHGAPEGKCAICWREDDDDVDAGVFCNECQLYYCTKTIDDGAVIDDGGCDRHAHRRGAKKDHTRAF
jgi:hypothetical protein